MVGEFQKLNCHFAVLLIAKVLDVENTPISRIVDLQSSFEKFLQKVNVLTFEVRYGFFPTYTKFPYSVNVWLKECKEVSFKLLNFQQYKNTFICRPCLLNYELRRSSAPHLASWRAKHCSVVKDESTVVACTQYEPLLSFVLL